MANLNWHDTVTQNNVNRAFENFWTVFSDLYQLHFPVVKTKFNSNIHRINDYMTTGLLVSRKRKLELCKIAAKERTVLATQNYRKYRNLFNTLMRASKKLYFGSNLEFHKKNPKKTWDILKEAANLHKSNDTVEKIVVNNVTINDPGEIANHFNDFFVNIGSSISQSITATMQNLKISSQIFLI